MTKTTRCSTANPKWRWIKKVVIYVQMTRNKKYLANHIMLILSARTRF
uniref:Uncharacterized protein n=1 Tax=Rhizophora mucronata TaxID=61149 RepID=A0A2P2QIV7_RHIMU